MLLRNIWSKWVRRIAVPTVGMLLPLLADAGERRAILIAVNNYQPASSLTPLNYAVKDVQDLRHSLLSMGYAQDDIVVLSSDTVGADAQPRQERIMEVVEEFVADVPAGHGESLLVVFAGHGFNSNGESFVCPQDYDASRPESSAVSVSKIVNLLAESPFNAKYLVTDACRNEDISTGNREFNLASGLQQLELQKDASAQGIVLFSSCLSGQKSYEDDTLQNGVYLHFFAKGLEGHADREVGDFNGEVSAAELSEYVARETHRFVQTKCDDTQRPWADIHATGELVLTTLTKEQKEAMGTVQRRTTQQVHNELEAQERVAEGVGLLISQSREAALQRFSMAVEKCGDNYMARRLRALLHVFKGNTSPSVAAEQYRLALADMQAVDSRLRIAIPESSGDLRLRPEDSLKYASRNRSQEPVAATVRGGDVLEVEDVINVGNTTWLRVAAIRRSLDPGTGQSKREQILGFIELTSVAKADANEAQLQDYNRVRKPTSEDLAGMNRRQNTVAGHEKADRVADGLGIATAVTSQIPGASRVSGYLGAAAGGIRILNGRRR